jgi:hypothetical protein
LLNLVEGTIYLVFQQHATGDDVIKGMYHAYQLRNLWFGGGSQMKENEILMLVIAQSYQTVQETFPMLHEELHKNGWMTGTDVTNIEPSDGYRLSIDSKE